MLDLFRKGHWIRWANKRNTLQIFNNERGDSFDTNLRETAANIYG
jgi:hypothetical protein